MNATRAAALLYVVLGAGFGVGGAVTLVYLAREGELPMTPFGFRSMAGGPFDRLGTPAFQVLGWTLVGICALDVLAGAWLWQGRRRGTRLGVATSLPALVLGVGFALPFLVVARMGTAQLRALVIPPRHCRQCGVELEARPGPAVAVPCSGARPTARPSAAGQRDASVPAAASRSMVGAARPSSAASAAARA